MEVHRIMIQQIMDGIKHMVVHHGKLRMVVKDNGEIISGKKENGRMVNGDQDQQQHHGHMAMVVKV